MKKLFLHVYCAKAYHPAIGVGNDRKMTNVGKPNAPGEDMTEDRWNWCPPRIAKGHRKST